MSDKPAHHEAETAHNPDVTEQALVAYLKERPDARLYVTEPVAGFDDEGKPSTLAKRRVIAVENGRLVVLMDPPQASLPFDSKRFKLTATTKNIVDPSVQRRDQNLQEEFRRRQETPHLRPLGMPKSDNGVDNPWIGDLGYEGISDIVAVRNGTKAPAKHQERKDNWKRITYALSDVFKKARYAILNEETHVYTFETDDASYITSLIQSLPGVRDSYSGTLTNEFGPVGIFSEPFVIEQALFNTGYNNVIRIMNESDGFGICKMLISIQQNKLYLINREKAEELQIYNE